MIRRNSLYQFLFQSYLAYRALYTWISLRILFSLKILEPLIRLSFFVILGRYVGKDPVYYAIGTAVYVVALSGIVGTSQVMFSEKQSGTLSAVIASPVNSALVFYSRGVFLMLDGLVMACLLFFLGAFMFGLNFAQADWPTVVLALAITSGAVSGLGLAIAALGLIEPDAGFLINIVYGALAILCGVYFPVEQIPVPFQFVSHFLPLTHGLQAIRMAIAGSTTGVPLAILSQALLGVVYLVMGYVCFAYYERLMRQRGTVEYY